MVSTSIPYFLSRPRRFGKSLLVSTFEAYFLGRKDLFEGLAISQIEVDWQVYPVFHIDLNARKYDSPADLTAMLNQHLEKWEAIYGTEKQDRQPEERDEQTFPETTGTEKNGSIIVFKPRNVICLIDIIKATCAHFCEVDHCVRNRYSCHNLYSFLSVETKVLIN